MSYRDLAQEQATQIEQDVLVRIYVVRPILGNACKVRLEASTLCYHDELRLGQQAHVNY